MSSNPNTVRYEYDNYPMPTVGSLVAVFWGGVTKVDFLQWSPLDHVYCVLLSQLHVSTRHGFSASSPSLFNIRSTRKHNCIFGVGPSVRYA